MDKIRYLCELCAFLILSGVASADVKVPSIFSEHAVLQRSGQTSVWGTARADEPVTVTLDKIEAATKADAQGKWKVSLDLGSVRTGPFKLVIKGNNRIEVKDVLVGEIWVCSGQSNMAFTLRGALGWKEEVSLPANPQLRQFCAKQVASGELEEDVEGRWIVASPENSGDFSGVAYYFGKMLQRELKSPVGLVNVSWPASNAQAWMSSAALDRDENLKREKDRQVPLITTLPQRFNDYVAAYKAWAKKYEREDHPVAALESFARATTADAGWEPVSLPGKIADKNGFPEQGVVWVRHVIHVSAEMAGKGLTLPLGQVEFGTVYWNGTEVDRMTPETLRKVVPWEIQPWTASVPGSLVAQGDAILTIRLFSPAMEPKLIFDPTRTPLLQGEWTAKVESAFPALSQEGKAEFPGLPPFKVTEEPLVPTLLFNGMIHPLLPMSIHGVIWYQGEANAWKGYQYRKLLPLLIQDWRSQWGFEVPFYLCQLPNNGAKAETPTETDWSILRESQTETLKMANTGMAVLIESADADLHPRNKKDPGERLARVALAKTYAQKIEYSGPVYETFKVEEGKVRLQFQHAEGGLKAKALPKEYALAYSSDGEARTAPLVLARPESELQGFAICGEDRRWVWADAKIDGDSVLVWSAEVAKPLAVRYAWGDNPTCNLYNGAGLPAGPFRTDSFPVKGQDAE